MDPQPGDRKEPEILFTHLMEGIGLALDLKGGRMFITDFAGSVYSANLDGSNQKTLLFARRKPHRHCVRQSCRRGSKPSQTNVATRPKPSKGYRT